MILLEKVIILHKKITNNYSISLEKNNFGKKIKLSALLRNASTQLKAFYSEVKIFELWWHHDDYQEINQACGKINILPIETVLGNWEGIVWFKENPDDYGLKDFKIFDFFVDEACVGFYDLPKKNEELYFLYFEDAPVSLGLNIEGYIEMLGMSYGFFYWQKAIIEIITGKENPESKDFKHYMPLLFPEFSYEKFVELYHQVKLKS
jgi:hypothetical protein